MSDHKNVYAAIAAVQAKLDPIYSDQVADAKTYAFRYASLPQIWRTIRPLIAEAGIAIVYDVTEEQRAEGGAARVVVNLHVKHPDSETEHLVKVPIPTSHATLQTMGASFTYARRYALHLAFGLAIEGEDEPAEREVKAAPPKPASSKAKGKKHREQQEAREAGKPELPQGLTSAQATYLAQRIKTRADALEGVSAAEIEKDLLATFKAPEIKKLGFGQIKAFETAVAKWEPPQDENPEPEQQELP